jgi:hypothetical protein
MKRIAVIISAAAMVFATLGLAHASSTFTDGGYSTTSADSSTCGGNWAQDLNVRNFTVQLPAVSPGVYEVTEQFAHGHFSTIKGPSPQSCQAGNNNTVKGGIQGTWSGHYNLTVSGGSLNVNGACELVQADPNDPSNMQCFTAGWIHGFFGDTATYTLDNWGFTYNASKTLPKHHWVNAQSGNSGDIASTLAP